MKPNQKLFFVVLCFSSILLLSSIKVTPPTPSPIYIKNIIIDENIIYTETDYDFYYFSVNGGQNWEQIDSENLPYPVQQQVGNYPELPLTLCLPAPSKVCYQTGGEFILASNDNGKTWNTSWSAPLGRKPLMERIYPFTSFEVFDLAYIEFDGKQIVIAATGTEGVLIKENNDEWQSIEVTPNTQTEQKVDGLVNMIGYTSIEIATVNLASFVLLLINSLLHAKNKKTLSMKLLLFASFFPISLVLLAHWTYFFLFFFSPIFILLMVLRIDPVLLCVLLPTLIGFYNVIVNTNKEAKINFVLYIIVIAISLSLFPLWANGVIQIYNTALWTVIILHTLLLLRIVYPSLKGMFQTKLKSVE